MSRREIDRVNKLVRHIKGVQENCHILGERLIERGDVQFGILLISRGFLHDSTKWFGAEWDFLSDDNTDKEKLKIGITQHNRTNGHHPEFWDKGIHGMPPICIAELVADWKARSAERGTSLQEWIDGEAMKRFYFTKNDPVYEVMMDFVKLILEPPLKSVTEL